MKKKNVEKKLAIFGITLCLALGLSACGGSGNESSGSVGSAASSVTESSGEEENPVLGLYKMVELVSEDEVISENDLKLLESIGLVSYIEFSGDGSVTLDMGGDVTEGSWDDSSITMEGEKVSYTLDGDTLLLTEDDTSITFVRTTQEAVDAILQNASDSGDSSPAGVSADLSGNSDYAVGGDYKTEPEVIAQNDDFSVTITGYSTEDDYYGFVVHATFVNKTSDKTLLFDVTGAAINRYMMDPFFATEVTAGNQANEELTFTAEELEQCGIASVDELILQLRVSDSDDWMADALFDDTITVYPTGKSADEITYADRQTTENEQVAVDDENCTFAVLSAGHDDIWGYTLTVYLENKTDKSLTFSWDDVAVNGSMVDPFWAESVMPGMRAYSEISFSDSDFEDNGITDVSSVEYKLNVYDSDDWMADNLISETFTYNP